MLCLIVGGQSNLQVATVETHWHVRHAEGTSRIQTMAFTRDLHLRELHVSHPPHRIHPPPHLW